MPAWRAALAASYCAQGRDIEARHELELLAHRDFTELPRYNGWLLTMGLLTDVCAHLGEAARARALYKLLLPFADRNAVVPYTIFAGPVSLYLGILATTARDFDVASEHFREATDAATRAPPYLVLVRLNEAKMLVDRGAGGGARMFDLLAHAEQGATALGLDKLVERIRDLRHDLPASTASSGARVL
jgi:hypothetical protein